MPALIFEAERPAPALDPRHRRARPEDVAAALALAGKVGDLAAGRFAEALAWGGQALKVAVAASVGASIGPDGAPRYDYAEVETLLDWLSVTGRDPFWQDNWRLAIQAAVASTRAGDRPPAGGGAPPPTRFRVGFRRSFGLRHFAPGTPLRLLLPAPLASAYHDDILVEPRIPEHLGARVRLSVSRDDALHHLTLHSVDRVSVLRVPKLH